MSADYIVLNDCGDFDSDRKLDPILLSKNLRKLMLK